MIYAQYLSGGYDSRRLEDELCSACLRPSLRLVGYASAPPAPPHPLTPEWGTEPNSLVVVRKLTFKFRVFGLIAEVSRFLALQRISPFPRAYIEGAPGICSFKSWGQKH